MKRSWTGTVYALTALALFETFAADSAYAFGRRRPASDPVDGDGTCPAVEQNRPSAGIPGDPFPSFKVEYAELSGYTDEGIERVAKVKRIIELAVNSQEFKDAVIGFTYNGQKAFVQNDGKSNEQIYELIRQGNEVGYSGAPHQMDFYHELTWPSFCSRRSAIGFTSPETEWVTTYGCKFWNMTDIDVAGHFFHEWLHKIGFDHDFDATARRPYSVPYGAGGKMEEVAAKLCKVTPAR